MKHTREYFIHPDTKIKHTHKVVVLKFDITELYFFFSWMTYVELSSGDDDDDDDGGNT